MRLSDQEHRAIVDAVSAFDAEAKIYLFGSRLDDTRKGGDIDLLILSETIDLDAELRIKLRIYDVIGEQKIDILRPKDMEDPFARMALKEGIRL